MLKAYKGMRIGKTLLKAAEKCVRKEGCVRFWLGVWEHNTSAQAFYQKEGFTKCGEHEFVLGSDHQTDWLMGKKL